MNLYDVRFDHKPRKGELYIDTKYFVAHSYSDVEKHINDNYTEVDIKTIDKVHKGVEIINK